jgi:hypothetical protein
MGGPLLRQPAPVQPHAGGRAGSARRHSRDARTHDHRSYNWRIPGRGRQHAAGVRVRPDAAFDELLTLTGRLLDPDSDRPVPVDTVARLAELVHALNGWLTADGYLPRRWLP